MFNLLRAEPSPALTGFTGEGLSLISDAADCTGDTSRSSLPSAAL